MPVLQIETIFQRKPEQDEYLAATEELEPWRADVVEIERMAEQLLFSRLPVVPAWIRDWAELFAGDGMTLDEAVREARQISRGLTQALSQTVVAERDEQR
jgi:hypothetical protein